jgi:copper homeostasis protein
MMKRNKGELMNKIAEICCGSLSDALAAAKGGAQRIELNSALALGGLSPSVASLDEVKRSTNLCVICMVRPRGGGFSYEENEKRQMFLEAEDFLKHGADGLAFGFLHPDGSVDLEATKKMTDLIHSYQKTAVFHRAIDMAKDYDASIEELIELGVDRILTSAQKATCPPGKEGLARVQKKYGDQIQILPGGGLNAENVTQLLAETGLQQAHSSCKSFITDPTTQVGDCSCSFLAGEHVMDYDIVDANKVTAFVQAVEY